MGDVAAGQSVRDRARGAARAAHDLRCAGGHVAQNDLLAARRAEVVCGGQEEDLAAVGAERGVRRGVVCGGTCQTVGTARQHRRACVDVTHEHVTDLFVVYLGTG